MTLDEVGDLNNLGLWLDLNGKRVQTGNTATLIFDVPTLVSYVSQFMSLQPGDVISTGTPPGVGLGMKPPVFLKEGDVMELGIDKLGSQKQTVYRTEDLESSCRTKQKRRRSDPAPFSFARRVARLDWRYSDCRAECRRSGRSSDT